MTVPSCTCTSRRATTHCPVPKALGLTMGEFNTLLEWPEGEPVQPVIGARARLDWAGFKVARICLPYLIRDGFVRRVNARKIEITDEGRRMRTQIQRLEHGRG